MPHDHAHHPTHCHHAPAAPGAAFALGAGINAAFVAVQAGYGIWAGSVALLADALHNLGDVAGLLIAWGAAVLTRRRPTARYTYGWGRSSILAALANALILLLGCGAIAVEAVHRLLSPGPVAGAVVGWVAAMGILVNGGTALLFLRGRHADLNARGAFLHLAADAAVSAGVAAAGVLIALTGWAWLDPATSLAIVAVITAGTWGLLRQSVDLAMDAVPAGLDRGQVQRALAALPGVVEVHDLHIWGLSTTESAATAHLVATAPDPALAAQAGALMRERFGVRHATIQVEGEEIAARCALRPDTVV